MELPLSVDELVSVAGVTMHVVVPVRSTAVTE
jgi:hypothetical protein